MTDNYLVRDRDFLLWLHSRLEHLHGENPNSDHMIKLRSIILSTNIDVESYTPKCLVEYNKEFVYNKILNL